METNLNIFQTSTFGRPSVFEIIALSDLQKAIKATILRIFEVNKYTTKYKEAVAFIFNASLDLYYLLNHGCLFAEKFYMLKRISIDSSSRQKLILKSIIFSIIIPYIFEKLEQIFNNELHELHQSKKMPSKTSYFYTIFPIFDMISKLIKLKYLFSYTFMSSNFHDPLFEMSNIQLKCHLQQITNLNFFRLITIFLHIFVHSSAIKNAINLKSREISLIPSFPKPIEGIKYNECPICGNKIKNPTALFSSGYVYCYVCIHRHLEKASFCPVTKIRSNFTNLVRVL